MNFGPNLHSQDGVMWSCSYYKKWSSSHALPAYKIWTNLDQWLLRYERIKNSACAHAQYGCLSRIWSAYLDTAHGYEQKSMMTLYLLNVIFTFKIAVKDFKCGRGKRKGNAATRVEPATLGLQGRRLTDWAKQLAIDFVHKIQNPSKSNPKFDFQYKIWAWSWRLIKK